MLVILVKIHCFNNKIIIEIPEKFNKNRLAVTHLFENGGGYPVTTTQQG